MIIFHRPPRNFTPPTAELELSRRWAPRWWRCCRLADRCLPGYQRPYLLLLRRIYRL
jgi:hypothetical protein